MPLIDYPPSVRPVRVIEERIEYHVGSGRLLDGLKYDREGKLEGRGVRDFPYLQPVAYSDVETIGPGANKTRSLNGDSQGNSPAWDEQTITFWLWSRREYGFYQRDTAGTKFGVCDWVAKVRDAVETKVDGVSVDRRLEETLAYPIQSVVSQNETTEIGWGVLLEFILRTDTYCAGHRFSA